MTTGSYKGEWEDQLLSGSCSSVLGALDFQSLGLSSTPDRSLVFLILSSHPLTCVLRKFMYIKTYSQCSLCSTGFKYVRMR